MVGEDRLIYASDYSHWDCLCPDSVKIVYERSDLSDGLKRKILSENAARLFGI
jgi:predicted TIM-barrel fold metal-dependent hydrolase